MTFIEVMSGLIVAFAVAAYTMFKKGGAWNPQDPFTEIDLTPTKMPPEPSQTSENTPPSLANFLKYQWQFENANPAINNPGNYRYYYGGYLPIYEPVKRSSGGFAIFPTLILGQDYAEVCTKNVIKNHPELTILTYIGGDGSYPGYAPSTDGNNPTQYATYISSHLGVTNDFLMRNLT